MPKLTIEQSHALPPDEVRKRLDSLNGLLATKYGLDARWVSETHATFKQTGASGSISCPPGRVVVNVDLSFALTPLRGKIEKRIREELDKALTA